MLRFLLASAAVLCAAAACALTEAAPEPVAPAFDMQRCVNMGNSLDSPRNQPWGEPIDPADFAAIRAAGFDTVRIPVRWSAYAGAGPDYAIEPEFMAEVEMIVTAALAADLNVILNVHHFDGIMRRPNRQTRKLEALWRQIGAAFADAPDDLWFEALNEPNGGLKGERLAGAQSAAIRAIRETNPDRIIILGGEDWSGVDTLDTNIAPPDRNIVYTFHHYEPFDFTHQKAPWLGRHGPWKAKDWGDADDRAELAAAVEMATSFRNEIGHPVFLGEFGVYDRAKPPRRRRWVAAVREEMEAAEIPWCLWSFSNTFALYDERRGGWDRDMLVALGLGDES